ncbi:MULTISPECIES: fimbrial protein [unclassified Variovorax]|uniref:fimbrial protein n=1 Tax=unclassified Variovorax TaxID=663243 RepID=UPI0025762F01|nr:MULTISPECIES: fimbrial protein [unclassified Variovorax]MDM0091353.1 fimbrial protein [Variovorax sp. J22G40]MDM0149420.1 fimbrial protein [Variovorax sp. J2P1-31]
MKRSFFLSFVTPRMHGVLCMTLPAATLLLSVQDAGAACFRQAGATAKSITMNMGKVVIPSELAVNAVIATRDFPITVQGAREQLFGCPGGGTLSGVMLQGTPIESGSKIYTTGVSGVGIRLSTVLTGSTTYPFRSVFRQSSGVYLRAGDKFTVELIKTAAVTGNGPLATGTYTQISGDGDGDGVSMLTSVLTGTGTTIITPSCTVDAGSRNIPVNFGKVATSRFNGRTSTAGARDFNIRLNCSAGQNAQNTVQIKMDATADPANVDGVLRLTPAAAGTNTAGGIGIQIVDAGTKAAVKFGDTVDVGPSKDGSYVLSYTARYYQTGNTVTPGQANGTATFTLDYR